MEIQERVRLALEHAVRDGVLPMEYALTIYAEIFPPEPHSEDVFAGKTIDAWLP